MSHPLTGKKTRRRLIFIFVLAAIITVAVISDATRLWLQIAEKNKEQKFLKEQLVNLQDDEQYLKTEVTKLQDPDYVARYAREKYLYSKDGEFTIRIP